MCNSILLFVIVLHSTQAIIINMGQKDHQWLFCIFLLFNSFLIFCIGFFLLKFDFGFDFEFDISIEFNLTSNSWIQLKLLSVLLAILVHRYNTFFQWTPHENDWD